MSVETLLQQLIAKISELVEASVSNYHKVFVVDTSKDITLNIRKEFSVSNQEFANSLFVSDVGGGCTFYINDEDGIPAITGLSISNEQFSSLRIVGSGAGTAKIRIGVYRRS